MDPIANMLNAISNAQAVSKETVSIPYSKIKNSIAKVLSQNNLVGEVKIEQDEKGFKLIKIELKYQESGEPVISSLKRISKPGRRVYAKTNNIPKPKGGLGTMIISTPQGIVTRKQAIKANSGGEIICEVLI